MAVDLENPEKYQISQGFCFLYRYKSKLAF